ncbi:TNFAIP3-interacting protein 1-like isoform X2 [Lineus longissimus]|uniref:TNFAIP3-interacting protein 1-like isoform X2 n=1 Tax=Lineus longissimus TaxID=88925 RepID=UPI00315CF34B
MANKNIDDLPSTPPDPGGKRDITKTDLMRKHNMDAVEQDFLKIKAENVSLYGKIRGLTALERMYARAKGEASTYKRLYEEMLAKDCGPESDISQGNDSATVSHMIQGEDMTDATDMGITSHDPEIFILGGHVTTDAAAGEGDPDGLHDSDDESAPASFQPNSHESSAPQGNPPSAHQSMNSEAHESIEESLQIIQPNTRHLNSQELRVEIPADMAPSPSLSPDSMMFQAQLMGIVKSDRNKLKKEAADAKEKLRELTEENENLRQQRTIITDLERELNHLRARKDRDGSPSSSAGDWVHVPNERTRDMELPVGATGRDSDDISPAHKAKIHKMQEKMAKLHRANREWEEHCKRMAEDHKRNVAGLKQKLEDEVNSNAGLKEHEQRRQREMESLFTAIQRQRSEHDVNLERDLHMEKQRSASYLERCLELEREANNWREQEDRRNMVESMTSPQRASSGTVDSLKTQIEVLKVQVTTYKEDFDTERKEREKLLREKNEFQETISNVLEENDKLRTENAQKTSEISRLNSQAGGKEHENVELKRKVSSLEGQVRHLQSFGSQGQYGVNQRPTAPPPQGYYGATYPAGPPQHWLCKRCSYRNEAERSFCEMCGNVRYNQYDYQSPRIVPHGPSPVNLGAPPEYPHIGMSNRPGDLQTDNG